MISCCSQNNRLGLCCYKGFNDCFQFHRPAHLKDQPIDVKGYLQVFSAKILLEVCGAAGAAWGSSEILTLRNAQNTDWLWRPIAIWIAIIFSGRFWWHSKHFLEHGHEFPSIKLDHRRHHKKPFVQIFLTKLLLEVCGAAGAIWGFSEALTWRNETNINVWRAIAMTVGFLFWIRWAVQILSYCLCLTTWSDQPSILVTILRWSELLLVTLILEVFGAAGAVWGFSEIVTLRTTDTLNIWRPLALGVGFLFWGRWALQIYSVIQEERESPHTDPVGLEETSSAEVQDLEMSDLALTESDDGPKLEESTIPI